jgi:hypothetical protein
MRAFRVPAWVVATCCLTTGAFGAQSTAQLVIHEWGTITTVHAADGTPQGGLNSIDESDVLPAFVHRYEPEVTRFEPRLKLGKLPNIPGRPDVTMRLETPVIYFHPPARQKFDQPIDVFVQFRGGVINEFYPRGAPAIRLDKERALQKRAAGVIEEWTGDVLNNYVVSSLEWRGVTLHDTVVAPLTNDPVWLAPREPQSASVFLAEAGEGERYLFYRGVAHLDALLQTRLTTGQVRLSAPELFLWTQAPAVTLRNVWLVEVRADGAVAFRAHGPLAMKAGEPGRDLARLKLFRDADHAADNLKALRSSMKTALIEDGLFADEAEAMLNTWKHSYFEKPGLRVFYLVPRDWTDYHLPLGFSVPASVNRVIVGRIDLLPAP